MLLGHRGKDGSKAWQVRRCLNWRILWGELRVRDRGKVKGKGLLLPLRLLSASVLWECFLRRTLHGRGSGMQRFIS